MRLEEAIIHAEYVAESNEDMANAYHTDEGVYLREESKCCKCADEHRQLAEWLVELKERRAKDEPQMFTWGKEVHEFCKMKCNKSKARSFDGDRFIVCGQSNDAICINLPACPLGKWIIGKGYHILPMDRPQTERSE